MWLNSLQLTRRGRKMLLLLTIPFWLCFACHFISHFYCYLLSYKLFNCSFFIRTVQNFLNYRFCLELHVENNPCVSQPLQKHFDGFWKAKMLWIWMILDLSACNILSTFVIIIRYYMYESLNPFSSYGIGSHSVSRSCRKWKRA